MFWGLMLKANRKYSQTIQKPFHLSQAALDVKSCSDNSPVQVLLTTNKSTYVLCTLRLNTTEQVALDLNFEGGADISFASQGSGNVHLTGYHVEDFDDFGEDAESDLENENEIDQSKKSKKQKKKESVKSKNNVNEEESSDDEEDQEEEDDEDEDVEMNEEDSGEDEEVEEEESDDSSSEDDEEEVQQPKAKQQKLDKPKENGVDKQQQPSKKGKKDQSAGDKPKGLEKNLQGGVKIEDLKVGSGPEAKSGKKVNVYYTGRLKSNNKMFDSSLSGSGFKFSLGRGEVIKGWDIGVVGMKVGGKRRIICPPHMAYGAKGSPPVIPPNSTLVFEVELKNIN